MKKLLALSFLAFTLLSCSKEEDETNNEEKKYDVTFAMSDFSQTVGGLSSSKSDNTYGVKTVGDTLSNWAESLRYRVYNSNGVLVNSKNQDRQIDAAVFGTIKDQLPTGNYTVFILATKSHDAFILEATNQAWASASYSQSAIQPWLDTFVTSFPLSVTSASTQTVRLDRVVGAVEVNLEDAIPTQAAKISIIFKDEHHSLYQKDNTAVGGFKTSTRDIAIASSDIGKSDVKFLMYVANTFTPSEVIIRAYNSNNSILAEKIVPDVRVYRNKKTTLSGKLFPVDVASLNVDRGFNIFVNPLWDTPPTTIKF